jgi:hypothetical protein
MWRYQVVAAGLLVACGGVVEGGSGNRDRGEPGAHSQPAPGGEQEPDAPGTGIDPSADTELGECVLGYRETWEMPCAWVADSRCYATREMACNCACPRDRDSQCVSGFAGGPDAHVLVACD